MEEQAQKNLSFDVVDDSIIQEIGQLFSHQKNWEDFSHLLQVNRRFYQAGQVILPIVKEEWAEAIRQQKPTPKQNGFRQEWYDRKKRLHRELDLPASICQDGTKIWAQHGKYHRDNDLPAFIKSDGGQMWYRFGKAHRDSDLPAVIDANGNQEWWINGQCHREGDLPAIVKANGIQEWWKNGQRHREGNQPAIIYPGGKKEFWVNGKLSFDVQEASGAHNQKIK